MALATYTDLKNSIADWLIGRTDLVAVIPDFITLAESQMNRKLSVRRMITNSTATITTEYAALPSDFNGIRTVSLSTGQNLDCIGPDAIADARYADAQQSGTPMQYAVVGNQFRFDPAPSATGVSVIISYYAQIPSLSVSSPSNWVLSNYPDAYLYGSLAASAPYMQDDTRLAMWESLFQSALNDINDDDATDVYGDSISPRALLVV